MAGGRELREFGQRHSEGLEGGLRFRRDRGLFRIEEAQAYRPGHGEWRDDPQGQAHGELQR
ncbi:hypothetical protein [Streptomyces sp. NBC_01343]|uniref:hypothetical protein n=1 Tax=Streptomyces sp. NBC_01343 TaxID=2903832 RepID=UPI002E1564FB